MCQWRSKAIRPIQGTKSLAKQIQAVFSNGQADGEKSAIQSFLRVGRSALHAKLNGRKKQQQQKQRLGRVLGQISTSEVDALPTCSINVRVHYILVEFGWQEITFNIGTASCYA